MAYIIYGVVKEPMVIGTSLTGLKGRDVSFVAGHGLCAAVSEIGAAAGAPPISELLVYSKVVEDLYRLQAVVPMRYGCFLGGIKEIQNALKERHRQYTTLLAELEGHVEMGIRVLFPELERRPRQEETTKGRDAFHLAGTTTRSKNEPSIDGRAYLAIRKVHYQMQNKILQECQVLIDHYIQAFSGHFSSHRIETDTKNGGLILSLYFLTLQNKVNRFRETFGRVAENEDIKAMLSGPWPPYNFVTSDLAAAKLKEEKLKGESKDGI